MAVGSASSSRLPAYRQLSESTSVLAAQAQGQENTGVLRTEGKTLHSAGLNESGYNAGVQGLWNRMP
jgi:hypothetical protein